MEESLIDKIYNEVKDKDIEIVLGGIGEPTYYPFISKAIDRFKNHQLTLTTNGTLLEEEFRKKIIGKVNNLVVSVDGIGQKFEEIRGFNFKKIYENLHAINELKIKTANEIPRINIQFVASKDNIDSIFEVMNLASELRAASLIVSNLIPQDLESSSKILYTRYENAEIKKLFDKIRIHSFRKGINVILPNIELKTERSCGFIDSASVVISSTGNVTPCYRFLHDSVEYVFERKTEVEKFSFGNIKDSSIADLYHSEQYTNFRKTILNNLQPSCMDCDYINGCNIVEKSDTDCYLNTPSCADCVWDRRFTICP